jgi:hypothetical protein
MPAVNPLKKDFLAAPSAVPMLDPSVGNPRAFKDPNSAASMSLDIQALGDQVQADTLYDRQAPAREGFMGYQEAYSTKLVEDDSVDYSTPAPYTHTPSARGPIGTGYRFEVPNCQYANPNSVAAEHCGLGLPGPFSWINSECAKKKRMTQKQIPKDIQMLEGFRGGMLGDSAVSSNTLILAVAAAGAGLLLCSFIHTSK